MHTHTHKHIKDTSSEIYFIENTNNNNGNDITAN